MEFIQNGEIDMDNVFSELRRGTKSSKSGIVISVGTGVATSIKAGDPQDLSADVDEGRQRQNPSTLAADIGPVE